MNNNSSFEWKCQPQAETLLLEILDKSIQTNSSISQLQKDLLEHTSTRLFDWIDHLVVNQNGEMEDRLQTAGFVVQESMKDYKVFYHPGAQLPRVLVNSKSDQRGVAINVESISEFLLARGGQGVEIVGTPFGGFRRCCVNTEKNVSLWVVERRGTLSLEPTIENSDYLEKYFKAVEKWKRRPRDLEDEEKGYQIAYQLAEEIIQLVGQNKAAWIILEVERQYWQLRNTAGQLQKNRQDKLGMGWANHDHHTFRSSRRHFKDLVNLFEMLGFHCRERYYTGREAGWGAQIMENPNCRLVLFLDVDLDPNEIEIDFAHEQLPELPKLGTIGLWCALHGDSIMRAGMHHLEAQFMFDELSQDLEKVGINMMQPFSSFPFLRQAFTAGERWIVSQKRVENLFKDGKITKEQRDRFLAEGAVGSHLENLQRREGYKGFNQKNVSIIIKKTDPRSYDG